MSHWIWVNDAPIELSEYETMCSQCSVLHQQTVTVLVTIDMPLWFTYTVFGHATLFVSQVKCTLRRTRCYIKG